MPRKNVLMDLYTKTSYELSRHITLRYSSSFGSSTKLFDAAIRPHIFAIYGLVRIADEIVDTYQGSDADAVLTALQQQVHEALASRYSSNPLVHAFASTAVQFSIDASLIDPFFESMRMDVTKKTFSQKEYEAYIYGSAEVIGLMCLRVFTQGDAARYESLVEGARALGAAYQKVNFLRDIASDSDERGRAYFPGVTFESFDDQEKEKVIYDIRADFSKAKEAINKLPLNARRAVKMSYAYYSNLLDLLARTPADAIKKQRLSLPKATKIAILARYLSQPKGRA